MEITIPVWAIKSLMVIGIAGGGILAILGVIFIIFLSKLNLWQ